MKLSNLTVRDFAGAIASKAPTPGGGSAAAASGAIGIGLLLMVSSFIEESVMESTHPMLMNLMQEMVDLIDEDALSFDGFMAAMKLPKETEEEKSLRREKMQSALKYASQVPFKTLKACYQASECLSLLSEHCKKSMISDLGAGSSLLRSASESAFLNIQINASSIKDPVYVQAMLSEASMMKSTCVRAFSAMLDQVESNLALT